MTVQPVHTKVGFTGTGKGMTFEQKVKVQELLFDFGALEVHHGDCIGADAEFHDMTHGLQRVVHPPDDDKARAFCQGEEILEPRPYLVRNRDIVDATSVLIAAPKGKREIMRGSGTWATIRYAEKVNRPMYIIAPDGSLL